MKWTYHEDTNYKTAVKAEVTEEWQSKCLYEQVWTDEIPC